MRTPCAMIFGLTHTGHAPAAPVVMLRPRSCHGAGIVREIKRLLLKRLPTFNGSDRGA